MKDIGINRLPLLAKVNGFANGEEVIADVQTNIRQEFGDGFSRISAAELARLRDKYYAPAPERVPGAMKLLDLIIQTLDPEGREVVATPEAGKPAPSGGSATATEPESSKGPPTSEADPAGASVAARAASVLQSLGSATASATRSRRAVAHLPLEEYANAPGVVHIADRREKGARYRDFVLSADGQSLTCSATGSHLYRVDTTTGEVEPVELTPVKSAPELSAEYKYLSQDGKYVYTLSADKLYIWEAQTGKLVTNEELLAKGSECAAKLEDPADPDWRGSFFSWWLSADAKRFVATDQFGIYEQDLVTGDVVKSKCGGLRQRFTSSDGRMVFSTSDLPETVPREVPRLFVRGEREFVEVKLDVEGINLAGKGRFAIGFSENGAFAAISVCGEGIYIWDTKTGERRQLMIDNSDRLEPAAISNDGRVLALLSKGAVQLYDVEEGTTLGEPIPVGLASEWPLQFSRDDSRLWAPTTDMCMLKFGQ